MARKPIEATRDQILEAARLTPNYVATPPSSLAEWKAGLLAPSSSSSFLTFGIAPGLTAPLIAQEGDADGTVFQILWPSNAEMNLARRQVATLEEAADDLVVRLYRLAKDPLKFPRCPPVTVLGRFIRQKRVSGLDDKKRKSFYLADRRALKREALRLTPHVILLKK